MTSSFLRGAAALLALGLAGGASAHTGHGADGLHAGLLHPFAIDHLLAMVAVGVWSAAALQGSRRWFGPATFLAAMGLGAALGFAGATLPWTESGIALSVVAFGALLAFPRRLAAGPGLFVTAAAALLHGLAHGAELPVGASAAAYAAGFLATTAALHLGGLALGLRLREAAPRLWTALGTLVGLAGAALLLLRA